MTPILFLQAWLMGLFSLGLVGAAVWLANEWQNQSWEWLPLLQRSVFWPSFGWDKPTLFLVLAIAVLLLALFGGDLVRACIQVRRPTGAGTRINPFRRNASVSRQRIARPDGSELAVQLYGPEDGIPVVLTHGWGLHGAEWNLLVARLAERFRVIVWDEPGLGSSKRPVNRDYSLEKLAADLNAVLTNTTNRPAVLVGHSIGGMIMLTFCRLFPETLGGTVAGLVLAHTTPTDPVKTTQGAEFYSKIENSVLKPLMHASIALAPLLMILNWLSYRNGSAHLSTMRSSFGGTETWEQIDFVTRFQLTAPPEVVARGMLGMMEYDATSTLAEISVPVLVVAGDRDGVTKPEASQFMVSAIPDAHLVTLSPAKHMGLIEHQSEFAGAVTEFVHRAKARHIAHRLQLSEEAREDEKVERGKSPAPR